MLSLVRDHVPRPLVAGVGLVAAVPGVVASLPVRLPTLLLGAALDARARYESFARAGAQVLGLPASDRDAERAYALRIVTDDENEDIADWLGDEENAMQSLFDRQEAVDRSEQRAAAPATSSSQSAGAQALSDAAYDREHPATESVNAHDLPIEDYDALSLGALRGRLAGLTSEDLDTLRDYESAHAARLPVLTMLENQLAKITAADA